MNKTKMADDNNKDEVHNFNFTFLTKMMIFRRIIFVRRVKLHTVYQTDMTSSGL